MIRSILFTIVFIISFSGVGYSAHIVGGDVTYSCISSNPVTKTTTFKIIFTMYRDAGGNGAPYDQQANFGVYEKLPSALNWTHRQTLISAPIDIQEVPYGDKCVIVPPNLRVQKANYIFEVELPWGENVYQISYQRCCRNNTINNIIDPASTGAAFIIEIYGNAIKDCNNSPVFKNFPPLLICNNVALQFDHSASDTEGDKLVYEFCTPLTAGGTDGATTPGSPTSCTGVTPSPANCLPPYENVSYGSGFSGTNPLGGSPQVKIDPNTGLISGTPNLLGQFVVGVCVKEYRNGLLIGSIRRDFQFNIAACQGLSSSSIYSICHNDSITINNIKYNNGGVYTQTFQTQSGCDSTLNIIINQYPKSEKRLESIICEGESFELNGFSYTDGGTFTQVIKNSRGCDSTITIQIQKLSKTSGQLSIKLCDQETASVNGKVYDTTGAYTQILKNVSGCDSTLNINVVKGLSSRIVQNYSLCNQSTVTVNNQIYKDAGTYSQNMFSSTGCDSIIVINIIPCEKSFQYDLEKCDALIPANSMVYDEFLPTYLGTLQCGSVSATNIFRNDPTTNKHSCTQGYDNSIAMCVSASKACTFDQADAKPIVFECTVKPEPGFNIGFNHLVFYHKSPSNFSWIAGSSGLNNNPTLYGIRVLKNGVEVYKKINISTSNEWKEEKYDFFENGDFISGDSATFRIEITPYCAVGNAGAVSVWDIDNVGVYLSCMSKNNRQLAGKIVNLNDKIIDTEIRRVDGSVMVSTPMGTAGSFYFANNNPLKEYKVFAHCNEHTEYDVTTFDIVLTQRHILDLEPFNNPLQYLAADVNKDGKVTAADIVEMRKVILGINDTFKHNNSWLFIDDSQFELEKNAWKLKDFILISPDSRDQMTLKFRAIKVGDVSGAGNMILGSIPLKNK